MDYILSNGEDFGWILVNERADSDHYPIIWRIKLKNISKSKKSFKSWKIIRDTNEENITRLLKCNLFFDIKNLKEIKWLTTKELILRPKIYWEKSNKICSLDHNWEEKTKILNFLNHECYLSFMHELNRNRNNPNLFFSQIRRFVQYKIKIKLVSKLKSKDNKILNIKESMQLALNFYSELYSWNNHTKSYCTNQLDYSFYIDKAWDRLSLRKATGIDLIPGEWIIKGLKFPAFKEVITKCFEVCIATWTISDFWAHARLILLNKNKNGDIPTIEETRPIAILSSIMKLFENSLIHHLENLVIDNKLIKNQRWSVEGGETLMNITEVISFGNDLKAHKIKGLSLFID